MQVVKNRIISRIRKIISVWIFVQIGFVFSANAGDIVITEFFYNKSAGNLPEYVELFNKTESTIDLNGWKVEIDGIQVEIDVPFNIDSFDYSVILSFTGQLRSYDGTEETTYCSSSHKGIYNLCDSTIDNLFCGICGKPGHLEDVPEFILIANGIIKPSEMNSNDD